eukprot:342897-Chlamydomonas_euryale.AAC.2
MVRAVLNHGKSSLKPWQEQSATGIAAPEQSDAGITVPEQSYVVSGGHRRAPPRRAPLTLDPKPWTPNFEPLTLHPGTPAGPAGCGEGW